MDTLTLYDSLDEDQWVKITADNNMISEVVTNDGEILSTAISINLIIGEDLKTIIVRSSVDNYKIAHSTHVDSVFRGAKEFIEGLVRFKKHTQVHTESLTIDYEF